jgi:hypothetical protein
MSNVVWGLLLDISTRIMSSRQNGVIGMAGRDRATRMSQSVMRASPGNVGLPKHRYDNVY